MSTAQRWCNELATHLKQAKTILDRLMACNPDFSSNLVVENSFDDFREECEQFVECHFGVPVNLGQTPRARGR
jgi:hypothetical protein